MKSCIKRYFDTTKYNPTLCPFSINFLCGSVIFCAQMNAYSILSNEFKIILYGNNEDKMIFENEKFECFLVGNPRAEGHTAISTKKHFRDMMEIDDVTCKEIFILAKKIMNVLKENGFMVSCIGKISDIFDGYGVVKTQKTVSNIDGMEKTIGEVKNHDFTGLCFVNLVEFDSEFGHRRDPIGYGKCIETFDSQLKEVIDSAKDDDLIIVTADHGNDPTWYGTDHTREKVPFIMYSKSFKNGKLLEERESFADLGATVLENFGLEKPENLLGKSIKELF